MDLKQAMKIGLDIKYNDPEIFPTMDPLTTIRDIVDACSVLAHHIKISEQTVSPDPYKGVICGRCGKIGDHFSFECPAKIERAGDL